MTGELFAKCPYDLEGTAVEAVVDSSRYFVIKIVDGISGNHAFVGLGFPERSWAFDLNVALQDHVKRVKAPALEQILQSSGPALDFSLKEGEKIQINIGGVSKKNKQKPLDNQDMAFALLPPPPPPGMQAFASSTATGSNAQTGWDDFGDFASANNSNAANASAGRSNWTTF